jgi:hypothetical protein
MNLSMELSMSKKSHFYFSCIPLQYDSSVQVQTRLNLPLNQAEKILFNPKRRSCDLHFESSDFGWTRTKKQVGASTFLTKLYAQCN